MLCHLMLLPVNTAACILWDRKVRAGETKKRGHAVTGVTWVVTITTSNPTYVCPVSMDSLQFDDAFCEGYRMWLASED